jgi:hypothetical protein
MRSCSPRIQANNLSRVRRQHVEQSLLRNKHQCRRIFQDEAQALPWIIRIERHVCAAGLEDSQHSDDHLQRPLDADTDFHLRPDTQRLKMTGQLVGASVQFVITQLLVFINNSHRVRSPRRLGLE